jgi:NDP-sugar pyrophosphorylase family protein
VQNLSFSGKFSIIDALLHMAKSFPVYGYHDRSAYWFDMGTIEKISAAEKFIRENEPRTGN